MEWERKEIIKLLNQLLGDHVLKQVYAREVRMLFDILADDWEFDVKNRLSSQEVKE